MSLPKRRRCRVSNAVRAIAMLIVLGGGATVRAEPGLQPIDIETWGTFQEDANGHHQWKLEPHLYLPWAFENAWTATLRIDLPMIDTNATGAAKSTPGYSGGIGNVFFEAIALTPELSPGLRLRGSLRLVLPSPKGEPFGNDSQYQWAPMLGMSMERPEMLRGVTLSPYVRWFRGFSPQTPGTTLVNSVDIFPTVSFGLGDGWALTFYKEAGPIVYNQVNGTWFVPLDLGLYRTLDKGSTFGFGAAVKLGNPSNPSYDYQVYAMFGLRF